MEYMRDLLSKQQAPAWVMPFARKRMGLEYPCPAYENACHLNRETAY